MTIDEKKLAQSLQTLINEFQTAATVVDEFFGPVVTGTQAAPLTVHLLLYGMMDHLKDVCEALTKTCNKHMPEVAERAEKLMTNEQMDSIEFMGKKWSVGTKDYAQVSAANKGLCIKWLQDHPLLKSLVGLDYHPASLQKGIKELYIDKGEQEKIPPFISVFSKRVLTARKTRGS